MRGVWISLAILIKSLSASLSLSGDNILVITDKSVSFDEFSSFFGDLKARGYSLTTKDSKDPDLSLLKYGERLFDHLILFSPETNSYGKKFNEGSIIEFVNKGGNVLLASGSEVSKFYQNIGAQFGITFANSKTKVLDPFNYNVTESSTNDVIIADNYYKSARYFSESFNFNKPILFSGIGHLVSSKNPHVKSVLKPSFTAYSATPGGSDYPNLYGTEISLISALQANNNARVTIIGSLDMFSDKFINSPIYKNEDGISTFQGISNNFETLSDLTSWTFQESRVLKSKGVLHHKIGESSRPSNYRIKDEMYYSIKLSEYNNGTWSAFKADDIQLEIIMLDPYIRTTLQIEKVDIDDEKNQYSLYSTQLTLPDVYGVFTFKVDYKRDGVSQILESDIIPIRPFKHNEYPRFLTAAYPYYISSASMGIAFVIFSAVWLYNRDPSSSIKKKTS